ncbi:MAG TPA: FAD-dependent monooxygenase [Candidatus Dormibacteraeota bacterium]
MSTTPEYDALIVGGRVAGASLALLLARQGRRVLVADRDEFPSDTMSTHFMSLVGVGALKKLGVIDDILGAGFRRITRHRTWIGDCCFEGPAGPPGTFSLSPRRDVLDSALLGHATKAGAQFEQRTRVDSLVTEGGRVVGAVLQTAGGDRREVRARVVVGADGKSSRVAGWVGATEYDAVPAMRPVYYGYFHGIEPRPEATVELMFGDDQLGFLFPMRTDEDCLAIELQPKDFDEFRTDHVAAFTARAKMLPEMKRRMQNAKLEGKLIGSKGIENYFRKPFGPGWALTGDAGYLKDPSTGLGITDAFEQSFMLAESLGAWFDGADWEQTMSGFQQKRDQMMKPQYDLTLEFTRMQDIGPAEQAMLRSVLISPISTRMVAYAMLAQLQNLSPAVYQRASYVSRIFMPAPAAAKA